MSTPGWRAPRSPWEPRAYVSQVTMRQDSAIEFVMVSTPHPIHSASITAHPRGWRVQTLSLLVPQAMILPTWDEARRLAHEWVSRLAGRDLQGFSAPQRIVMGRGLCPYLGMSRMCARPAGVGTVWCDLHPRGRQA